MSKKAIAKIQGIEKSRIQSPSSINTFRQCPRKYYYSYIEKIPTKPSIHLVRGTIAHEVAEDFFKINIDNIPENNMDFMLKIFIQDMLSKKWVEAEEEFAKLDMPPEEINFYLNETKDMIQLWFLDFMKVVKEDAEEIGLHEAFKKNTPKCEEYFRSEGIGVQGYVDAILEKDGEVKVIDYKTSKRDKMSDDYRLQLAIYALLYHERYGKYPDKVGLFLFRHGERLLDVDEELLEFARIEVAFVHENTQSKNIMDYPKKKSILCNWGKGQCDFYDMCFKGIGQQRLNRF